MEETVGERWQEPTTLLSQWAGVLLGPLGWALHLQVSYTLAAFACEDVWRLTLHATFLVSMAIALAGLYFGWTNWQASKHAVPEGHRVSRSRFMAVAGIGLSAFFAVVIVAQWIPTLFLEPCRY
jgi:uncharacterized membrane protein YidH (DUF202 family)